MFKAGGGQAFSSKISVNFGRKIGVGIYCSPHVQTSLGGYTKLVNVNGQNYCLVFQCRVNPKQIHICPGQ
jgi:hypothetical protein